MKQVFALILFRLTSRLNGCHKEAFNLSKVSIFGITYKLSKSESTDLRTYALLLLKTKLCLTVFHKNKLKKVTDQRVYKQPCM